MWNSQTRYTLKKLKNKKHVLKRKRKYESRVHVLKRKRKYESRVHVLKHKIKLSIIITTYNSSIFLKDCLKSVCNQIYDDVEIIIFNDCSQDNTDEIILKFKKKFKFLKYINNKKNIGIGKVRNKALEIANGEFILFIDSDDLIKKDAIKTYLKNILKYPETYLFFLNYLGINRFEKVPLLQNVKKLSSDLLVSWRLIYKKKFLKLNKLYFLNSRTHEDMIFVAKCIIFSKKARLIKTPYYVRRNINVNSLGRVVGSNSIKALFKSFFLLKQILDKIESDKLKIEEYKINFARLTLSVLKTKIFSSYFILNKKEIIKLKKEFKSVGIYEEFKIIEKKQKYIFKGIKIKIGKFDIIIFCASAFSYTIIKELMKTKNKIKFIVDNNKNYSGQYLNKIKIYTTNHLISYVSNHVNYRILVCNSTPIAGKKILNQLININIPRKNIILNQLHLFIKY